MTLVIHAGAETGFQESADTLGHTNISGTRNMLMFSEYIKNLRRFVYISTAYVSGQKKGLVTEEAAPEAGERYTHVQAWAKQNLSVDIPAAVFTSMPILKGAGLLHNRDKEGHKKNFANNLLTLLPYFYADQTFDRTNTDSICGPYDKNWMDHIDSLLTFACRKNFMKQTGQTVFEQACVLRTGDLGTIDENGHITLFGRKKDLIVTSY